jgi:UDP-GlcNAc:undecaprenyl-phosphate/decaprenyl-phosphate GlcNAc-1-phosphate transferase
MTPSLLAFLTGFALCAAVAPLFAFVSRKIGLVDRPDGYRKLHRTPIPLTGGPSLLISVFGAMAVVLWVFPDLLRHTDGDFRFLVSLLCSSAVIVLVGIIDDRFGLMGRQKLVGQVLAAAIMVPSGIGLDRVQLFGHLIEFGDLSSIVTMFWLLGAINALNLIDGVDGLASTTGIVLSLSIAAVTFIMVGRPDGWLVSLVLAGSLTGFLVYNFPPARMFLGDSGSMLIGLLLGSIALKCSLKQYTALALIMPTAIWAIPLFDVAMAIVRRKLTGRSIYATDRGHLHHCLERKGHSGGRLLLVVGSLCALTGLGAVASAFFGNELIAVVAVVTAIALLLVTRSFGHAELMLLTNRVRRFAGTLLKRPRGDRPLLHDEQVRLHGDQRWEELWLTLVEFAERFHMDRVELMVHLPNVGEEYHATWKTRAAVEFQDAWKSEIPLLVSGMRVGHIKVVGAAGNGSICAWMSDLIGGLRPFETQLVALIEQIRERKPLVPRPASDPAVLTIPHRSPA